MIKKQLFGGSTRDVTTCVRMPTSPFGRLFSFPPIQVHVGGQLGRPLWDISGWCRSSIVLASFETGLFGDAAHEGNVSRLCKGRGAMGVPQGTLKHFGMLTAYYMRKRWQRLEEFSYRQTKDFLAETP